VKLTEVSVADFPSLQKNLMSACCSNTDITISTADTLAHHSQQQHTDMLQSVPACSTPVNPSPLALTGNMVI